MNLDNIKNSRYIIFKNVIIHSTVKKQFYFVNIIIYI